MTDIAEAQERVDLRAEHDRLAQKYWKAGKRLRKVTNKLERLEFLDTIRQVDESPSWERTTDYTSFRPMDWAIATIQRKPGHDTVMFGQIFGYTNGDGKGIGLGGAGSNFTFLSHDGKLSQDMTHVIMWKSLTAEPDLSNIDV